MKLLRGGNDITNDNTIYFIIAILLIIIVSIGVYFVFFRKSETSTPTSTSIPTSTNIPTRTSSPNKMKTLDKIKNSQIIKNIESNLKEWRNDIEKLPKELKEAAINCYSNPQGCIF